MGSRSPKTGEIAMKPSLPTPRVIDNDRDEIAVTLNGNELRGWSYSSDQERRMKMLCAREFVEGYCAGADDLDRDLVEMKAIRESDPQWRDAGR